MSKKIIHEEPGLTIEDHGDKVKYVTDDAIFTFKNEKHLPPVSKIPDDADDIHVFAIKPSSDGNKQAFIGFTLPNGNFSFIQVPFKQ